MDIYRRKSWMWAEACALLEQAERKHRQFFDLIAAPASQAMWEPPADIFADGSQVTVIVALPGARVDEVIVQLTPTGLQIDTTVPPPSLNAAMNVVRLEIPYGRMRRRIELPPGHYVLIERRLDRGCLHLRLTREAA
jgi:HSP20 family molecular chaperone IbpA